MDLLRATTLPWSTDWTALFGAQRPLILEIGFGYGQWLRHLTRIHPDANIVGVEISNVCLTKAEGAIMRGELPNVRVIYTHAETALYHLFEPESIHEIHINFPDPWFKNRHGHRRLIQRDTLDAMVNRMETHAKLYLATDILEYAEMSAELLAETPGLTNLLDAPWVHILPGRTITKYEARAKREGRACYYFAYQRNTQPALEIPVYKDHPMPHLVLSSPLAMDEIRVKFKSFEHKEDRINVHFMGAYIGDEALLFDTFVDEPTIEQRVALVLIRRDESPNEYTLRLGTIGSPRPTEGMHIAVRQLSEWLMSLHPDMRVIQHKLRNS